LCNSAIHPVDHTKFFVSSVVAAVGQTKSFVVLLSNARERDVLKNYAIGSWIDHTEKIYRVGVVIGRKALIIYSH